MKILLLCCAATVLPFMGVPSSAQEGNTTGSSDLQNQIGLDASTLAVLPIQIMTTNARAPDFAAEAYDLILGALASMDGLYVIGGESVLPYADSPLSAVEIARGLGAGNVLESSIRADIYTISLQTRLIDAQTGRRRSGETSILWVSSDIHISNPPFNLDTLMPDMAARVAGDVQSALFPTEDPQPDPQGDPQQAMAKAEAIVLDTSFSDNERLDALKRLPRRSELTHGSPVVFAAAQIATSADDSEVRYGVWQEMARVDDPYLIQPLLHTLANDVDDGVRRIAGENLLTNFIDEPGVRAALEHAAENDPSEWVRNRIRLSMLPNEERNGELLAILSDSTKSDNERLGAAYELRFDRSSGFIVGGPEALSGEAVIALVDVARSTRNRRTRSEALSILSNIDDPFLIEPFLIALANDSYEHVRDAAARGLGQFLDQTGVREALEDASVNDPSPLVRKTVSESLGSIER
jgi:HEAT repeat protein